MGFKPVTASLPLDAHVVHAEERFLLPETECIRKPMILVHEKIVRQPVFFPELAM